MTPEDKLPIPIEIPWQLASTTRTLVAAGPLPADTTAISLFTYVPNLASLDRDYPQERLVYLKFTVSVSPFAPTSSGAVAPELLLGSKFPIWGLLFDLRINDTPASIEPPTNRPRPTDAIRPYFLAASPTRRTMTESGAVGEQVFEGGSDQLAVGKSGSQLHETFNSTTKGGSFGIQIPLILGHTTSSSSITGGRDVVESLDTTNRQASEERRELLSHLTNVNNVLSLLTASLVGSPHLRFLLWPVPLRQLSRDPTDPNLWYAEFIKRRSSGIEGMQDFYAIAAVPRAAGGFCVEADLKRVFVLEPPPPDFTLERYNNRSHVHEEKIIAYLTDLYPQGTPVDALDVDVFEESRIPLLPVGLDLDALKKWYDEVAQMLVPNPYPPPPEEDDDRLIAEWLEFVAKLLAPNIQLPTLPAVVPEEPATEDNPHLDTTNRTNIATFISALKPVLAEVQRVHKIQNLPRPVVWGWFLDQTDFGLTVKLRVLTEPRRVPAKYKWSPEVWLEMKRAEYEEEIKRPPLVRGQPAFAPTMLLRTCFSLSANGTITVLPPPTPPPPLNPASFDNVRLLASSLNPIVSGTIPERRNPGREAVLVWNSLDSQLAAELFSFREEAAKEFRFDDDSILNLFLRGAERLRVDDPANQPLDEISRWANLPAARVKTLRKMNIRDLRELAAAINVAPAAERQRHSREQLTPPSRPQPPAAKTKSQAATEEAMQTTPEPVAFGLSARDAAEIRHAIGKGLQARHEKTYPPQTPEKPIS